MMINFNYNNNQDKYVKFCWKVHVDSNWLKQKETQYV